MHMTRYLSLIAALLIILGGATSCSRNDSADASDLLATVPSDASVVAVANLQSMLEKSGCKIDNAEITPSDDIKKAAAAIKDQKTRAFAEAFFNSKSGIDPTVAVFFSVGYYKYVTGVAADPSLFKETVSKISGGAFSSQENMEICGNVALKGNQFWVNIGSDAIDAREAKHFATLSGEQSFISNSGSERLTKFETDIEGWANIAGALNAGSLAFQQRAMIQVAMQTIFDDAADASFSITFNKGEAVSRIGLLNSKGKPAKYLLASGELDPKIMESIGGNADALFAMAVPQKLIEQLRKDTQSKSASILGAYLQALGAIDGTVAIAANLDNNALKGVVSTNGQGTAALNEFLNGMGLNVKINGRLLDISKGELTGKTPVSELSKDLKGAMAGIALTNPRPGKSAAVTDQLTGISATLSKESASVVLNIKTRSAQPDQNFLLTVIRSASR